MNLRDLFALHDRRRLRWGIVRGALHTFFRSADALLLKPGELATKTIFRILVLRPNHRLGNVLMLTPLISEIECTFPGAEIDVLVAGTAGHDVFSNFVSVRRVHAFPHYALRHLIKLLQTIIKLRSLRYDLIVDPCVDSNSNRMLMTCLKTRHALAIPFRPSGAHTQWSRLMNSAPAHLATLPVYLLRHALTPQHSVNDKEYPRLDMRLTKREQAAGLHVLNTLLGRRNKSSHQITIGIFANATGAKRYDESWWLRFINTLVGQRTEFAILEIVAADACSRLNASFPGYYSTDPRKLAALISNLDHFISADCGVMHLACASGARTIGLFSVTDASRYEPYGGDNRSVVTAGKDARDVACNVLSMIEDVRRAARRHDRYAPSEDLTETTRAQSVATSAER